MFRVPSYDTDILELLRQSHNLIVLEVNMQVSQGRQEGRELILAMVLLPRLESLKFRQMGPASPAIFALYAPSLKLLHYRCPHRYQDNFGGINER